MRFSEAERYEEDVPALHHTLDLFDAAGAAGARPVLCDGGGPERTANPGRGGEDADLRLDGERWRALADNVARAADAGARARLRAGLPPPHVDLRRGRAGDRALPRGHRRRAAARLRPPAGGGRGSGRGAGRLGRADRRGPRQGRPPRRARPGQGRARRHADRLAPRPVLRARAGRRRPRRLLRARSTRAATTAGSSSSRTACSTTSRRFEGAAQEQVANRAWLEEHAGW